MENLKGIFAIGHRKRNGGTEKVTKIRAGQVCIWVIFAASVFSNIYTIGKRAGQMTVK